MKEELHFILDFETWSQDRLTNAVVDCSYMIFDWNRFLVEPYTFEEILDTAKKDTVKADSTKKDSTKKDTVKSK